jgi:hypothetical protein
MPFDPLKPALSRRAFIGSLAAVVPLGLAQQADSLAGRGATGTLRDPTALGRSRSPTDARENSAEIQAI